MLPRLSPRLGKIRSQCQGLATDGGGLLPLPLFFECMTEIDAGFRKSRLQCQCLAIGQDRLVESALGQQGISKIVVNFRVCRPQRQDLAIQRLGLCHASGLMMGQCKVQYLLNGHRRSVHTCFWGTLDAINSGVIGKKQRIFCAC